MGRGYYASLTSNYQEPGAVGYGSQPIPHPASAQLRNFGVATAGVAALAAAGIVPTGGTNVFSRYYMPAIRAAEEFFPFRVARTFQVSNFLSQFEDQARITRAISPEQLGRSLPMQQRLRALTGIDFELSANHSKGVVFHGNKLYFGGITGGKLALGDEILGHAAVVRNKVSGAARFVEGYDRQLGLNIGSYTIGDEIAGGKYLSRPLAFTTMNAAGEAVQGKEAFAFIGGRTAGQHVRRQMGALANASVERFNLLSRSMGEIIPEGVIGRLRKAGVPQELLQSVVRKGMGVEAGSAGKTLAKLAGKWGLVGGGLYFGYDMVDHLADQMFGMGPTKLAATAYTGARINLAEIGQASGMSAYSRTQEDIAPGSTNLLKLMAFPAAGAATGLGLHYLETANLQQKLLQSGKFGLQNVGRATDMMMNNMKFYPSWFKNAARWAQKFEVMNTESKFLKLFSTKLFDKPVKMKMAMGAAAGLALIAPFLPGALMPQTSPDELRSIYSGEQPVAIRRGRWWEMGRSPWEGNNISYYRPHWYPLLMSGAREKSIYGKDVSALEKFYLGNFTYNLEESHYYDRPYPISGTAFEDFPLIGPLLAGTVGRIIKPPRMMHEDEFMTGDGGYKYLPPGFGEHRATELGELDPGAPINPYGFKGTFGEQMYRFQEMSGLWGFAAGTVKTMLTGEETFFSQESQLESARRMYGAERDVWDRELGGGFGIGEVLRRVFPHRRREISLYNPIRNTMPEWLPGAGDRSPDFLHGDPYTKVTMGDIRLPGAGYEALHPELEGMSPSDYPDIYKFQILSDVAPYSEKTLSMGQRMIARKRGGLMGESEAAMYAQITARSKSLMDKKEFSDYKYEGQTPWTPWGMMGKYWENLAHGATSLPSEFLTPFSPFSKMLHMRSAEEDYEQSVLYGTQNAFWQNPVSNFLSPFFTSTAHAMGWRGHTKGTQREIEQYFDALKYLKYTRLMEIARENRDYGAVGEFNERRQETLVGLNPYTHTYAHIFRSLPRRERDYFNDFSAETDPAKQREILEMVPENVRGLYVARWRMIKAQELLAEKKAGGALSKPAEAFIDETYSLSRQGGVPMDARLRDAYQSEKEPGESYPDWYRRTRVIPESVAGNPIPGPDWVGWHPAVDLDDIKLKLVTDLGYDMHDFDLWRSDEQNLARRPFINQQAVDEVDPRFSMSDSEISSRVRELLSGFQVEDLDVSVAMYPSENPSYNVHLDLSSDRSEEAKEVLKRGI